jgi:hypothetical protein
VGVQAVRKVVLAFPVLMSRIGIKGIPFWRKILYEQRGREQTAVNNTEETRELA